KEQPVVAALSEISEQLQRRTCLQKEPSVLHSPNSEYREKRKKLLRAEFSEAAPEFQDAVEQEFYFQLLFGSQPPPPQSSSQTAKSLQVIHPTVVLVLKRRMDRFCVDFRYLNSATPQEDPPPFEYAYERIPI